MTKMIAAAMQLQYDCNITNGEDWVRRNMMKVITTVLLLFAGSTALTLASPNEHPHADQLLGLLGLEISSSSVTNFVAGKTLSKSVKFDSGSFTPPDQAYSLLFHRNQIECVILHSSDWPKG
jgi:hypothetical protein